MRMDCQGKGTFFGTVANLVNSAVGAGMLSLPFAYQASGLVLGSALLCVFALLVTYSLHVIGRAQKQTNSKTYQEVARKVLGARAEAACIYGQLLFFVGVCVGFLDIIPDQLVPVLQYAHAHHSLPLPPRGGHRRRRNGTAAPSRRDGRRLRPSSASAACLPGFAV